MDKARVRVRHSAWVRRTLLFGVLCLMLLPVWQGGKGMGAGAVYGPYGPEGQRLREQLWIVPGADPKVPLRATVFRPPETTVPAFARERVRRPLVVINHGSAETTREAVSLPVFYWLSKWFVDRGYVVVLPQRRGYGATGGELAEGHDTCANPNHRAAGLAAAADIDAVVRYMAGQAFVDRSQIVVTGVSTGGWAALALASMNTPGVRLVVNFAGGRGGHAYGQPNVVCGPDRLIEAAGAYGEAAKVPTLWIYAANDSYFGPELAASMTGAWVKSGGQAELRMLPAYGSEGHDVVADQAGWRLWGGELARSLAQVTDNKQLRLSGLR